MASLKCVERDFIFDLAKFTDSGSLDTLQFLDIGQVHSLCNRLSARQGMAYGVESIEIGVAQGGAYTVSIWRLPMNWCLVNGWEKGMRMWFQQREDTARDAGLESTRARYDDFKVFMGEDHQSTLTNLFPIGFTTDANPAATDSTYEWQPSRVSVPNAEGVVGDTDQYYLHMLGGDSTWGSKGLVEAYAESRSRPQPIDPNIVDDADGGLYADMFNVGMDDEETIGRFQTVGNEPPYLVGHGDMEYYPSGQVQGSSEVAYGGLIGPGGGNLASGPRGYQLVDILSVNASFNYNSDTCGSFIAPLGLLAFKCSATGVDAGVGPIISEGFTNAQLWMRVRLSAGGYLGVAAIPMQDVN
jgi:hypothetical protein